MTEQEKNQVIDEETKTNAEAETLKPDTAEHPDGTTTNLKQETVRREVHIGRTIGAFIDRRVNGFIQHPVRSLLKVAAGGAIIVGGAKGVKKLLKGRGAAGDATDGLSTLNQLASGTPEIPGTDISDLPEI